MTLFATAVAFAEAQQKIGYIDWQFVASQMPDMQHVNQQIETLFKTKEQERQKRIEALQAKSQKYSKEATEQTQAINRQRSEELQALQQKIRLEDEKTAREVQEKKKDLMQPLINKLQKVIDAIAEEEGYDIVLDSQAVLYFKNRADDLAPKAMKRLGIKPKK